MKTRLVVLGSIETLQQVQEFAKLKGAQSVYYEAVSEVSETDTVNPDPTPPPPPPTQE